MPKGHKSLQLCLAAACGVLGLAAAACGAVNPQTAFNPRSEYADDGLNLFILTIVLGVVIGVVVEIVLVVTAIRYRRRPGDVLPPQIHGSTIIEILWTTGPVLVVGAILFFTVFGGSRYFGGTRTTGGGSTTINVQQPPQAPQINVQAPASNSGGSSGTSGSGGTSGNGAGQSGSTSNGSGQSGNGG